MPYVQEFDIAHYEGFQWECTEAEAVVVRKAGGLVHDVPLPLPIKSRSAFERYADPVKR